MIKYTDWGKIGYQEAWDKQEVEFNQHLAKKAIKETYSEPTGRFVICEHPHVYTLGKSGNSANMLLNDELLKKIDATYVKTNRGGDITYHGPGQIVGYPIIDLESLNLQLKEYISKLEDVIIDTIADYGLKGERLDGATGVWLDPANPIKARKICAIGVKASRYVTMHGFALNVNTNLDYFTYINPCGFVDKGVTSLKKELNSEIDINEVKSKIFTNFEKQFNIKLQPSDI
ncbi:MAG: lipoyl(octanoyl) transferase LipB [Bacteroidales bacterium]|nr:lipoyl(octanoyl) transferase LipB [Bacteroidales bacterium]